MYDFLFELTDKSENEGEQILYEGDTLDEAWVNLTSLYGFREDELRFLERMEIWEGELLGLDTY